MVLFCGVVTGQVLTIYEKRRVMDNNKKKNMEKLKKRTIFYVALLSMYFILTLMAAVIFEYYTVTTSHGKLIFSLSMSWQIILFAAELVTIVLQGIMLVMIMKQPSKRRLMTLKISGEAAGVFAFAAVVYLLIADGFRFYPALIFAIYMLLIVIVRAFLIPRTAAAYIEGRMTFASNGGE